MVFAVGLEAVEVDAAVGVAAAVVAEHCTRRPLDSNETSTSSSLCAGCLVLVRRCRIDSDLERTKAGHHLDCLAR